MGGNEFVFALQCGYKQGYKEGAIAELKKINEEIELMDFDFGDYYDYTDTIIEMVSKVIYNRIKKIEKD